jgi:anti-anti-sigma regulatory factor
VYGIQLFLDCKRHADEAGKRLILFKPGASFREILEQAGFSDWFEMRSGE